MSNLRANQASDALIKYESGQEIVVMHEMTTDDNRTFASSDRPWSGAAGAEPTILPNGILTGGIVTPTPSVDNSVTVSAATCNLNGVENVQVSGAAVAGIILPETSPAEFRIDSIVIDSTGEYAREAGAPTTNQGGFSATRGAAGGPPWIPTDAIEVAQVRRAGTAAAQIVAAEIQQRPGIEKELAEQPVWSEDYALGTITFVATLPAIHSDNAGVATSSKAVFCEIYTPQFADAEPASDFVPPETTHSVSSTQVYGGAIGASSSALSPGSFKVFLRDGVRDPIVKLKNQKLWFQFFPHRLRAAHLLCQGVFGIARTYPAGDSIQADCSLTPDAPALEVEE